MISNGYDVAVIEHHVSSSGGGLTNTYSQARINYYGISGIPNSIFDGNYSISGGSSGTYGQFLTKYNQRIAVPSDFSMSIAGFTSDFQACEVVVDVSKVSNIYGVLKLHVFVTESNVSYNGSVYNFVNRLMLPNQNGTNLDFVLQNNHLLTIPFNISSGWEFENCEVVAYIQNNSSKEIYQAVKLSLNDFNQGLLANFSANIQNVTTGQNAIFTDLSSGDPISWDWTFEGGTPDTFYGQIPPAITYDTPGLYDVSLTVSDGVETDTKTITDYISVSNYCEAFGAGAYMHISNVTLGDINNSSGQTEYADYTYLSTDLNQGEENVALTILNGAPYDADDLGVWVDWNQDGDFDDTEELLICEPDLGWAATGTATFYFDVTQDAMLGETTIRIRVKFFGVDCGIPCGATTYGEVEDYTLNIVQGIAPPVADFNANNTIPVAGESINFYDLSLNSPESWDWAFDPATITYTGGTNNQSQHPQVQFNEAGFYSVTLTVSNPGGNDSEIKYNYIQAINPNLSLDISLFCEGPFSGGDMMTTLNGNIPLTQPYNELPWNYNGNEQVVSMPANIVDWVILELRDAVSPELAISGTVLMKKAALLRNDGKVLGIEGQSFINFETTYSEGLFLVVHHRNHLSIMSSVSLVESSGVYAWNFSNNSNMAFGDIDSQKEIAPGVWGMIAGDSNADGVIDILDFGEDWKDAAGLKGYRSCDFNFDSEVNNVDKNDFSVLNRNRYTLVP